MPSQTVEQELTAVYHKIRKVLIEIVDGQPEGGDVLALGALTFLTGLLIAHSSDDISQLLRNIDHVTNQIRSSACDAWTKFHS